MFEFNKNELMEIEDSLLCDISLMEKNIIDDIKNGRCEEGDYGVDCVRGLIEEKKEIVKKVRGYIVTLKNVDSIRDLMKRANEI